MFMEPLPLELFEYLDYRDYLKDWYTESKKQDRITSFRYIAQKTGVDSAWIVKVFQKAGHLNDESLSSFIRLCGLDERRAAYFQMLVRFNKAKKPEEQRDYFQRLLELRDLDSRRLETPELLYLSDWSIVALRTLIGISRDTSDIEALGRTLIPPITADQARHALQLLIKLGMVIPDGRGGYDITDAVVTTGGELRSAAARQFHNTSLEMAQESLDRHDPRDRDISTLVLSFNNEDLPEIKERITEFRKGLLKFAQSSSDANRVFLLNVSVFPVSGVIKNLETGEGAR